MKQLLSVINKASINKTVSGTFDIQIGYKDIDVQVGVGKNIRNVLRTLVSLRKNILNIKIF